MENATKALLIAAAVLIVMLIISLGLYIFFKLEFRRGSRPNNGRITNRNLQQKIYLL